MATLINNLLTYQEYLDATEQTLEDVSETSLKILVLQQTLNKRLACLGITDITLLTTETLEVLKAWTVLYITNKISNSIKLKAKLSTENNILVEVDDGNVKEKYEASTESTVSSEALKTNMEELWCLFVSLALPDAAVAESAEGIGVAARVKVSACFSRTQGTV